MADQRSSEITEESLKPDGSAHLAKQDLICDAVRPDANHEDDLTEKLLENVSNNIAKTSIEAPIRNQQSVDERTTEKSAFEKVPPSAISPSEVNSSISVDGGDQTCNESHTAAAGDSNALNLENSEEITPAEAKDSSSSRRRKSSDKIKKLRKKSKVIVEPCKPSNEASNEDESLGKKDIILDAEISALSPTALTEITHKSIDHVPESTALTDNDQIVETTSSIIVHAKLASTSEKETKPTFYMGTTSEVLITRPTHRPIKSEDDEANQKLSRGQIETSYKDTEKSFEKPRSSPFEADPQCLNRDLRKPHLSALECDRLVSSGGHLALQVRVGGDDTEITWYKEQKPLTGSATMRTFREHDIHTLLIPNVTERESGRYTCRARNRFGLAEVVSGVVQVVHPSHVHEGRPATFITRPEPFVSVLPGHDLVVSFRVAGDPKPKVTWTKGLRDMTDHMRCLKETIDDYVRLSLRRLTVDDFGTYCVAVRNQFGCDRSFVTARMRLRSDSTPEVQLSSSAQLLSAAGLALMNADYPATYAERHYLTDVPDAVPGEPIVTDMGRNWLSLWWSKAICSGAAPVVAYRIELWQKGAEGARWQEVGLSRINSFDVFNLQNGGEYQFRVTPRNRYGWGPSTQNTVPICLAHTATLPEFLQTLPYQGIQGHAGQDVILSCKVSDHSSALIEWYKDGQLIEHLSPTRVDNSCFLTIPNANSATDSGRYCCKASTSAGHVSTSCEVRITDSDILSSSEQQRISSDNRDGEANQCPEFSMRLNDRRVQMGDPVRLTCRLIDGRNCQLVWYHERSPIQEDDTHRFWSEAGGFHTLELSRCRNTDAGVYRAVARNNFGSVSCNCTVHVEHHSKQYQAPVFQNHLEPALIQLRPGAELKMTGRVMAYPPARTIWYRDAVRLRPCRRIVETLDHDGRLELTVASVTMQDAGSYRCVVTNEMGSAESGAKVVVHQDITEIKDQTTRHLELGQQLAPRFVVKPLPMDVVEGDNVTIYCEVVGDPRPEIKWLRDFLKTDYYRDAPHFHALNNGNQYRLEIPNVRLDYTGTYTIWARNIHGDAKAVVSLQVKISGNEAVRSTTDHNRIGQVENMPAFTQPLSDIRCCDGDSISFECQFAGCARSEPTVRWEKDGKVIELGGDFTAETIGTSAHLTIGRVYAEDQGEYACHISNSLGHALSRSTLSVDATNDVDDIREQRFTKCPKIVHNAHIRGALHYSLPRFFAVPRNRVALVGDTVRFQCSVGGHPDPCAKWMRGGRELKSNGRIVVTQTDDLCNLTIENVQQEDSGTYRIVVCNSVGYTEASAMLDVVQTRRCVTAPYVVRACRSLSPVRPRLRTEFISADRYGSRLNLYGGYGVSGNRGYGASHRWHQQEELNEHSDLQHYSKTHKRVNGHISRWAAFVDRLRGNEYEPIIISKSGTHGEDRTKNIAASKELSSAIQHISCLEQGRELKNDERTSIISHDGISCLLLQNITADDSGKYDVYLENCLGSDSHFASVSVEGPPDPPSGKPCVTTNRPDGCVYLTWSSAPYDGGRKVTGYAVDYSLYGSDVWSTIVEHHCDSLSYDIGSYLRRGAQYVFRVRAINVHGTSKPSLESDVLRLQEQGEYSTFSSCPVLVEPGEEFLLRYGVLEELGKGRFGVVHKVVDRQTSQKMAAKVVRCRTAKDRLKVLDEIDIMNRLQHQMLLQLVAAFDNPKEMILVTEYISGGELFERVVADDFTLMEMDCILFMRQICEGVAYMHLHNIVHLDLKPENIMCHTRTSHEIKIIDFGLARVLQPNTPVRVLFGTPEFVAPEIINYEPIGWQTDMWAVGVICYVLLSGLSPFMGDNDAETFANITRADYDFDDEAFNTVSQDARDFIGALLVKRKTDRLSAEHALRHPWLDINTGMRNSTVILSTDKLKKFIIRRKWQKTGNAIRALGRMANLSAQTRRNSSNSNPGSPPVSRSVRLRSLLNHSPPADATNVDGQQPPPRPQFALGASVSRRAIKQRAFSERSDSGFSDCASLPLGGVSTSSTTTAARLSSTPPTSPPPIHRNHMVAAKIDILSKRVAAAPLTDTTTPSKAQSSFVRNDESAESKSMLATSGTISSYLKRVPMYAGHQSVAQTIRKFDANQSATVTSNHHHPNGITFPTTKPSAKPSTPIVIGKPKSESFTKAAAFWNNASAHCK